MPEAEGSCLKHVRDAWMDVLLVALVGFDMSTAKESRQIFVNENVLQRRNHQTASSLENLLVAPRRVHLLYAIRKFVVPAKKENRERQKRWILIGARIAENWKQVSLALIKDLQRRGDCA